MFRLLVTLGITVEGAMSSMMILWGYPSAIVEENKNTVVDWNGCVSLCESDVRCIFAYSKAKTPTTDCYIYYFTADVASIQISDGITDTGVVALKINDTDQCATLKSDNFPISRGTTDGQYVASYDSQNEQSSIKFAAPASSPGCPDGFKSFVRVAKTKCLKVVFEKVTNQDTPRDECRKHNSSEAGSVETQTELQWINEQALPFLTSTQNGSIWVAALRRNECGVQYFDESCTPMATESFEWGDPTISGTESFERWKPGKPTGPSEGRICVVLGATTSKNGNLYDYALDDILCENSDPAMNVIGFLCTKTAKTV